MKITDFIQTNIVRALGYGRLGLYSLESLPIITARRNLGIDVSPPDDVPENQVELLRNTVGQMIEEDQENINKGLYPLGLLIPENPIAHLYRYLKILNDNVSVAERFKERKHQEFSKASQDYLSDLPDYYKRNFHNQTNGYLSTESADLYTHQVEILFKGSMGLMRRTLLADLITYIKQQKSTVKILELACGQGDSTEILLKSCNNIHITALDISEPYITKAKENLKDYKNIHWVTAAAEDYKTEEKFDLVFSSFLFHEIPKQIRHEIFKNIAPLINSNGQWVHIDSIQMDDNKNFNWALKQFPKDFHEPFYTQYIKSPLESDLPSGFEYLKSKQAFLSKSVWLKKRG